MTRELDPGGPQCAAPIVAQKANDQARERDPCDSSHGQPVRSARPGIGGQTMDQTFLARVWLGYLLAASLLLLLPGCDGCRIRRPAPTTERKKPEAPKPDFESKDLRVLPVDESLALQAIKPGHWFSVQQEIKSNRADFFGELDCRSGNQAGEVSRLRQSYFGLHARRAVSLPKGQAKTFELTFLRRIRRDSSGSGCTATCVCRWEVWSAPPISRRSRCCRCGPIRITWSCWRDGRIATGT